MKIFDPISLAGLSQSNRLWRSATNEKMADDDGRPNEAYIHLYEKLAQGGVGLIVTGCATVMSEEQPSPNMLAVDRDDLIPDLTRFTTRVHAAGGKICAQIMAGGPQTIYQQDSRIAYGPSAVAHPLYGTIPKEMTHDDIAMFVDAFGQAARRVQEAGFDAVQIHGAHGYLVSCFLTPFFNRRTDAYGGSIENRGRFLLEILDAIRSTVGSDFPVFVKMHGSDHRPSQGFTLEDALVIAQALESHGLDAVEISGGYMSADWATSPMRPQIIRQEKQSYFAKDAAAIAEVVSIPVISTGGHRSPEVLNALLHTTRIAGFGMSRTLLSEPDLPHKWRHGYTGLPRCVSCNKCFGEDVNMCILDREKEPLQK
ncbi:NADH:flavin oxidoreductase [Desulfovibrio inopinatus]|uniref:NADH:flavin oxidoreductase n=1 Tax=Desulfovibrio inopinatus TaxID=102109 RepID=UPI00041E06CE|nr:NADH:flavin oxidoreductase [Desulfovibrio inopinatus]